MATTSNALRASARLISSSRLQCASKRTFRMSARRREAQNYKMPALSPTMTEGNISSWKFKEGDSFQAGDVILEIETDKATMDVEAQDDGIVFKIIEAEGAKGIKVGQRIAVFADEGDDLSTLEVPADEGAASQSQSQPKEEAQEPKKEAQEPKEEVSKPKGGQEDVASSPPKEKVAGQDVKDVPKRASTLLPSVEQLLHANGYSSAEADKITPTGPSGRLLKGDVLAYLGRIDKKYPAKEAERLEKRSHLDLSNIVIAEKAPSKPQEAKAETAAELPPAETEVAVPISLAAVLTTQKRVQDSLGIFLPLSTFIARASELANEDLPEGTRRKPTSDELFDAVLGLDRVSRSSRGHFIPQITGISPAPLVAAAAARAVKKPDIIDMLAPRSAKKPVARPTISPAAVGISADGNIFSVTAKPGDEARALEYLERMKLALEKEPGRLVL